MRIIVMSDSHRNAHNVRQIVEKHQKDADLFLHLGDGEAEFETVMQGFSQCKAQHVCGNCDFYSTAPASLLLSHGGKRIFLTHGHLYHVKNTLDELLYNAAGVKADVVLYGHTHVLQNLFEDGVYVVNPGSCSGAGSKASYVMLDLTAAGVVPVCVTL